MNKSGGTPCLMLAWEAHERALRGWLIHQLHDSMLAEDLLQDVFLKALRQGQRFCDIVNARAWLFEVTRNTLADLLRRSRETVELPDELQVETDNTPPVDSLAACLPRALSELSERDREAITLCDLQGMTQEAFAILKQLSLSAAKSRVQRARTRLRTHLSEVCQVRFDERGKVCCFVPREPVVD